MKNYLFISMVAFSLLLAGGCKKKTEADPCEGKVCLNGGVCQSGVCACPAGYTGADCGTQIAPTKIRLDSTVVTKFPAMNGSNNWDSFPDNVKPDIYFTLRAAGGSSDLINNQNDRIQNASGTSYKLTHTVYDFTDMVQQYKLTLWDYDGLSSNDKMGEVDFEIYNSSNNFPNKITVSDTTGKLEFDLYVSYTH